MATLLDGKVALVTGAGRGLGRAHALALADAGACVLVNDYGGGHRGEDNADGTPADQVVAEIHARGGSAVADYHNVADWRQAGAMVNKAVTSLGRLDIVVNNAGICRFATIDEMSEQDWHLTLGVNLTGTAAISHWAAAYWRSQGAAPGRAIINTSSPAGTNPAPGSPAYCASKAGVAALTISVALELAPLGVRVNAIAPMARTRMTLAVAALDAVMKAAELGFDRVSPENVSPLVIYLASRLCRFTGRTFGIEGDDMFLFDGWSAERHFNNDKKPWTAQTLADVLAKVDRQDRGWFIAPSTRIAGPAPPDETMQILESVESGWNRAGS